MWSGVLPRVAPALANPNAFRICLANSQTTNPSNDSSVRTLVPFSTAANVHVCIARMPNVRPDQTIRYGGSTCSMRDRIFILPAIQRNSVPVATWP